MKKTLITAACALVSVGAFAQGTLYMYNNNNINDNTGAPIGSASGTDITVELLEGNTATSLSPLAASICYVNQGSFYGPAANNGVLTISGAAANTSVFYAVEVWSTSAGSYAGAQKAPGALWGESAVNTYTLGGGSPPLPANPLNFASFNATLNPTGSPEPTTIALGAMGAGALLLFRRRK